MKTQITRINKMFFASMLILSLGYTSTLTFTTNVTVDDLTIAASDKVILNDGVIMTVTGAVSLTGILQMLGTSIANVTGAVTVESDGILDMDGTSRLKLGGNLRFNSGTLQAETGTGIDLNKGGAPQSIIGTIAGNFKTITRSGNATVFDITLTIEDSLDTGGMDLTISNLRTLTMGTGSVVVISGGNWTRTGALVLWADSKVLYTGSAATMQPELYGDIEHNGGTLTMQTLGGLNVAGTFRNISGNFAATQNITANGIIWNNGNVTESPSETWVIGAAGITITGGTFVGTDGAFTVAGDWTNSGTFTHNNSDVDFVGPGAQTITSGGSNFFDVSISNTGDIVSLADAFVFEGAALTIDAGAKFALAGQAFTAPAAVGRIVNSGSGIFMLHGDEVTTPNLDIPGATKFVATGSLLITRTLGALDDVTFDASGHTLTFNETIAYISGDITVASNTTLNMATHGLTIAHTKTVTNNGNWPEPTGGTLTCAGSATFIGLNNMSFYIFSAAVASSVLIFKDGNTYTVANNLTLTGTDENEIHLRTNAGATAILSNTGGAQSVDYVKVDNVDGTSANHIVATNSWDINRGGVGAVTFWDFGAMLYTFETTGNWDTAGNWEQGILPAATDNVLVSGGVTLTLNGTRTINDVQIAATGEITV
ncbi:MAG TPA: hypothetical protein EYO48_02705, partial [Candidatus Marinimicrobia bacterium]|nr:hypothetical protein [Candidatus Neomarinimicrobiota bacterium]